jgi:hypothetical protein
VHISTLHLLLLSGNASVFFGNGNNFQFLVLLFGLPVAPQMFTRVFQTVVTYLHTMSVQGHSYVDDSLLTEFNLQSLIRHIRHFIKLFLISLKDAEIILHLWASFTCGWSYITDLGLIFSQRKQYVIVLLTNLGHNYSASGCSEMALSQSIPLLTFNKEVETI